MKSLRLVASLSLLFALLSPGAAHAAAGALPFKGFGDMVVDEAHDRLFVTGGKAGSSIAYFDLSGNLKGQIEQSPGAGAMVLDGSNLYVLLSNAAGIDVIDTGSLERVKRITAPLPAYAGSMTFVDGLLWYGSGTCGDHNGALTSVNPSTDEVKTHPVQGSDYCPAVAKGPGSSLFAWDLGISPATIEKYDVSSGTPSLDVSSRLDASNLRDIELSPDGHTIYTASGSPYEIEAYSSSDLSKVASFPTGAYPNAVEVSSKTSNLAAGIHASYDDDVKIFPSGSSTPKNAYDFGEGQENQLFPGALEFAPDGERLFAVTGDDGESARLRITGVGQPTGPGGSTSPGSATRSTSLSLDVSKKVVPAQSKVLLTAKLRGAKASSSPISIYATPSGGQAKLVKSAKPSRSGVLKAFWKVTSRTTFRAAYVGDANNRPSNSAAKTVNVRARISGSPAGYESKDGKYFVYRATPPILRVKVAPNQAGASVHFVAQMPQGSGWGTFDTATAILEPDSTTNCVLVMPPGNYRIKAEFKGGPTSGGASTKWYYVRILAG